MSKWLANVYVTLKPVVNDPPGLAIRDGLHNLGYDNVTAVRVGKYIQAYLEAETRDAAQTAIDSMCRRLLANPVIEDYTFRLEEADDESET
ncbi:MAG TPA: phosphoribosylformylglycinamidine synthase subunit PurS [Chloroflexia bacterium]|nr:phosphoribosylformylglycinamidine synthase subunit PurS [Chloroflexia bacterium]